MKQSFQQQRKEHLILHALQNIFLIKIQKVDPKLQSLTVSVVKVEASKKVSFVRVYLNILPEDQQQAFIDTLNENKSIIRKHLGDALKDKLRIIPDLRFYIDTTMMSMRRIEELLKNDIFLKEEE